MSEKTRLEDLLSYKILDTPAEQELDEITEIATAICDTPISLITLIDDKRQWVKSKMGIDMKDLDRQDTFCQYALNNPNEVLVVENALDSPIYNQIPLVNNDPHIRFYAGAPLVTPDGNVLGTLCIIDDKPKKITPIQKRALELLAKRVMNYLDNRKLIFQQQESIEMTATQLKRLTDQAPGVIYQSEISKDGEMSLKFVSKGISKLNPKLDAEVIKNSPADIFGAIHPEDLPSFKESIQRSYEALEEWSIEYRILTEGGHVEWHAGRARPEKKKDGTVEWFGTIQDITNHIEYEQTMEQISFDISHVLRHPVTTLLGLTSLIENEEMDEQKLKEYSRHIKTVSQELDNFTRKLNETYQSKKMKIFDLKN